MIRQATLRCLAAGVCLAISYSAAPAGAEWFRLSQGGDLVVRFRVSPDGRWAVYAHDAVVLGRWDLWSVALPSGTPVKLNGLIPVGFIPEFEISPDSRRVVYRVESPPGGPRELFSVPIAGPASAAVKLNRPLVAGGAVESAFNFEISPNSARVVYRADQEIDGVFELYSVPIAGPASSGVKLNAPLVAGGDVTTQRFGISPNSARVVYLADQEVNDQLELYSVPIAGPASSGVKLNGPLVAGGGVVAGFFDNPISPNSARVVYRADQETDEVFELYSVPIAGPASSGVKLNGPLVPGGTVSVHQISPNSGRVVYRANQDDADIPELYSVPIAGPASSGVKLNGPLVFGRFVTVFRISANSARVVYEADQATDGVFELYGVPIAGPASSGFKLNGPLVAGGEIESFAISADSAWAVYAADQELDGWPMGYRAPLAGPAGADERIWATAVNVPSDFAILPDSSAVAVRGNSAFIDGIVRLWTYPLAGTPDWSGTDWLGGEFQPNGRTLDFELLPDGSGAVYIADQEIDGQAELYVLYFRIWGDGFETGDLSRWSDIVP